MREGTVSMRPTPRVRAGHHPSPLASFAARIAALCSVIMLATSAATLTGCASVDASSMRHDRPADEPLNIVLLYADDWRHDTLGCAGNPVVRTPRLDALARDGVRFTHNAVTTSICGVSRATMLTGQWMSRHGNRAFGMFATPWSETFPAQLRAHGYWVGHIGKWHNGKFPAAEYDSPATALANGTHWIEQPGGTRIHVTEKNERDAIDFLRARPSGKPFCLTVAFFATHAEDGNKKQYLPQPASMELYRDATVPVPPTATEAAFRALPAFLANDRNEGRNRWKWRFDTPERYQESMKNYYRLATEVDAACGRVIDELARQGVLDRTLVIFTTDNGYLHGEHGLADKWYPYEESIRVPLILWDPRMPAARRGTTDDARTLNVDLAPTILAAARIAAPAGMQGRDIAPLYLDAQPPAWRNEFYYEHPMLTSRDFIPASEAVVARDWKYILWPDWGVEQLFDLAHDPREERDLAADPAHAPRLAEMRVELARLRRQSS
jgi:arylsulfatase A-like enzyme